MSFMKVVRIFYWVIVFSAGLISCEKYLDENPSTTLITPSSIADLQSMLDYYMKMNQQYPSPVEILSDDYYVTTTDWNSVNDAVQRNLYLWQADGNTDNYWNQAYNAISIANSVLDELPELPYDPEKDRTARDNVKGSALFFRAYYFYGLAQLFAKPFNANTASFDPGIVLKLNPDINEKSIRSSIEATYRRILNDLKESATLLPATPFLKSRPSIPAAYGALARTYLVMQQYDSALRYADLCLSLYDSLIDYNTLNPAANVPVSRFNKEVIFDMRSTIAVMLGNTRAKVDSNLYKSFDANDLRKKVFFKANSDGKTYQFKGDYSPAGTTSSVTNYAFVGIVTDEMYLIRAECYARSGNKVEALEDLNTLLRNRYMTGQFTPVTADNANEALIKIINERRKELYRRGTRWTDIRRFMNDPQFAITPQRIINDTTYTMDRLTLLLPQSVIVASGMSQNE